MLKNILKISVSLFLITILIFNMDTEKFFELFKEVSIPAITGALLLLVLQSLLVSSRWGVIISKFNSNISYVEILKVHYLALGSSVFLPNIIAEPGIKSALLKKSGMPISDTILSVILDKLFVVTGLLVMTIAVMPTINILYNVDIYFKYSYFGIIIIILLLYLILTKNGKDILLERFAILFKYNEKILLLIRYLFFDKQLIQKCIFITFISQFTAITAVYILSMQLNLGLSFFQILLLMPPVMLVTAIPIAFNGWGSREIAMIYVLDFVNISTEQAFTLSVQFGLIGLLLWGLGLLSWLRLK